MDTPANRLLVLQQISVCTCYHFAIKSEVEALQMALLSCLPENSIIPTRFR
nr:MAG TPA: hypothetical protein [Caudoviricetes sp.]